VLKELAEKHHSNIPTGGFKVKQSLICVSCFVENEGVGHFSKPKTPPVSLSKATEYTFFKVKFVVCDSYLSSTAYDLFLSCSLKGCYD